MKVAKPNILKFSLLLSILTSMIGAGILTYLYFHPNSTAGKLEEFPTITDNTFSQEIKHSEIVTKQDILNFKLEKVNNPQAFQAQLAIITHKSTKYQLEFTEHKVVFLNENDQEKTLLNKIEVTKFETFISNPPTNESLNNTPEGWKLVKREEETYLKITPYNRLLFLDSGGKQLKRFHTNLKEEWANQKGQLAKERGDNLRNWADFNYPTNKSLLFQKFYYWQNKQENFTSLNHLNFQPPPSLNPLFLSAHQNY